MNSCLLANGRVRFCIVCDVLRRTKCNSNQDRKQDQKQNIGKGSAANILLTMSCLQWEKLQIKTEIKNY